MRDEKPSPQPSLDSRRRVLLVDDDRSIRRAVGRVLASKYTVHVAEDADVALQLLGDVSFDAVIADHDMPGLKGLELLEHVSRRHPAIIRILMSGRQLHRLRLPLAEGVVHMFLRKPVDGRDLVECLLQSFDP